MDSPPPSTRLAPVRETLHGVEVVDPYRWLEDTDDPETRAWTEAQNARTRAFLDGLPYRPRIRRRLAELWEVALLGTPLLRARRYFFAKREHEQDQGVLYVRRGPGGSDEVVVDPHGLDPRRLVTLDWWYPSNDGRLVAYGLSAEGDEMSTLHVIDVDTKEVLADRIPDTRYSTVAWLADRSGFYYTRYPKPGTVPPGEERYNKRVRFHRLGADAEEDALVFGDGRAPTDMPSVSLSRDGRWLLVHVAQGWAKTSLHVLDREHPEAGFRAIGEEHDAIFHGRVVGGRFFVHTNWEAPNWRVLELDPSAPDLDRARVVIPERADVVLATLALVGGVICADELEDATSRVRVYETSGAFVREVPLPELAAIWGIGGEWDDDHLLFTYQTYLTPSVTLLHDVRRGETAEFDRAAPPRGFDATAYEVRRLRCRSRDGTAVPIFLIHRKGMRLDGSSPAILNGYGGFNVNRTPTYIPTLPLWIESGGVYAVAVLRGGGEFGEAWHRAGMLGNKQNVFDDFIAAADWLVRERYTSRERLAIWGGSNGGLLVGAAMTQRPDLCRAVVCTVPLLDMLRYHHFQIAKLWIAEYGSADDPEQFRWLHAYSPYHGIRDGERYPAVFLATALGDSRVDPMHARKMAALLQAASASGLPVLLRVESEAGHGIGKPRWKQIEESADLWSFVCWQLGVEA